MIRSSRASLIGKEPPFLPLTMSSRFHSLVFSEHQAPVFRFVKSALTIILDLDNKFSTKIKLFSESVNVSEHYSAPKMTITTRNEKDRRPVVPSKPRTRRARAEENMKASKEPVKDSVTLLNVAFDALLVP